MVPYTFYKVPFIEKWSALHLFIRSLSLKNGVPYTFYKVPFIDKWYLTLFIRYLSLKNGVPHTFYKVFEI
jgi:hypothetical protein